MECTGLVLSGGGARGAYQAGVLSAVAEVAARQGLENPFPILSGVSAGAINASIIAGFPGNFVKATNRLTHLWSHISTDSVFYADLMNLSRGGWEWVTDFSFRGPKKSTEARSLFSTTPLRSLLTQSCHFENIPQKIQSGQLSALSVSTLEYDSISQKTFFQGAGDIKGWERPMHRGESSILSIEHVMASSAIPILFPPVKVGDRYYGDGCVRNQSPCGPAIYMGAEKLLAIGVRRKTDTWFTYHHAESSAPPNMARLINVIFHSVMMDGLELDVQRIQQTNAQISLLSEQQKQKLAMREVQTLWICPSVDMAKLAVQKSGQLPRMIRLMLPGNLSESGELLSFLLFEAGFCEQLVEIGFADGMKAQEDLKRLFESRQRRKSA